MTPLSLRRVVLATGLGFVVVQLDVTIVNVALPRIGTELGGGVSLLQWVVDAYALAFAVLLLTGGTIGDLVGARRPYIAGFVVFGVASLACGLAPSPALLLAARAAQGVGAALLVPTSLALLNHAFAHDAPQRARAVGWWTAAGGTAIAAGPVVGGVLLDTLGWRSIFLVNLPICAIAIALVLRFPDTEPRRGERHLDVPGQILAILSLSGLTVAVIESRPLGVLHPLVLLGALTAVSGTLGFIAVEARSTSPMLPLEIFRRPGFSPAVVFGILVNLAFYGIIFVLSLYLQRVRGFSAGQAGLAFLPLMATVILSNVASGWITARAGGRAPMIAGALLGALGFALLLLLGSATSYPMMLPAFILIPVGIGLAIPAMTTTILAGVPSARAGTASAVLNAARQAGGVIGVAIAGALIGGGTTKIVAGLRMASVLSGALLVVAAVIAMTGIRQQSSANDVVNGGASTGC